MRISDWSSDVCSSDLVVGNLARVVNRGAGDFLKQQFADLRQAVPHADCQIGEGICFCVDHMDRRPLWRGFACHGVGLSGTARRSEEHTSELQSLMRNSYAVFCFNQNTYIQL